MRRRHVMFVPQQDAHALIGAGVVRGHALARGKRRHLGPHRRDGRKAAHHAALPVGRFHRRLQGEPRSQSSGEAHSERTR